MGLSPTRGALFLMEKISNPKDPIDFVIKVGLWYRLPDHLLVQRNLYVANEHPPYCKSVIAIRKLRLLLQIILNNRVKQEQIFVFCWKGSKCEECTIINCPIVESQDINALLVGSTDSDKIRCIKKQILSIMLYLKLSIPLSNDGFNSTSFNKSAGLIHLRGLQMYSTLPL